ncbi:MAG TPA: DUF547 domain-containing protein [Drouetiella sp.]
MKKRFILVPLVLLFAHGSASLAAFDNQHKLWTHELKKYVDGDLIHYAEWQKKPAMLDKYLKELADITPEEFDDMTHDQRKALWMNAYNAFTVKLVLDHYPIHGTSPYYPADSFRQVPDAWEKYEVTVAGKKYTLEQIEHDILRAFRYPEVHFAVVPAAKGCAAPRKKAFVSQTWETDMASCKEKFLSDKNNINIDPKKKTITVSQIFKWFPLDFAKASGISARKPPPTDDQIVLAYLAKNLPDSIKDDLPTGDQLTDYAVVYKPNDWSLNDADASKTATVAVKKPDAGKNK